MSAVYIAWAWPGGAARRQLRWPRPYRALAAGAARGARSTGRGGASPAAGAHARTHTHTSPPRTHLAQALATHARTCCYTRCRFSC